jgi:hypothetical protein
VGAQNLKLMTSLAIIPDRLYGLVIEMRSSDWEVFCSLRHVYVGGYMHSQPREEEVLATARWILSAVGLNVTVQW